MKTYYEQAVEAAEKMRQATPGSPARQGWRDEVLALTALWQAGPEVTHVEAFEFRGDSVQHYGTVEPAPVEPRRAFDTGRHLTAVVAEFGVPEPIDVRILNDGRVELRRPDDQGRDWTTAFDPDSLDVEGDIPADEPLVEVPVAPAEVIDEAEEFFDEPEEFFDEPVAPEAAYVSAKKGRKK